MNIARNIVQKILHSAQNGIAHDIGSGFAPVNIALCKYWGKRDETLNLPLTNSLSISLPVGTTTEIKLQNQIDSILLDGQLIDSSSLFYQQIHRFLCLIRPQPDHFYHIKTRNDLPTSAGLASSASGFAALVFALNALYEWNLDSQSLSILARMGSGSACRSIYSGFVEWVAGTRKDGLDSYAQPLNILWKGLCLAVLIASKETKSISSKQAMRQTVQTSFLFRSWPEKVSHDMRLIKKALSFHDFSLLGMTLESNALNMHATMLSSWPPICYWNSQTLEWIHVIWNLRKNNIPIYFSMDAGPSIKLFFEEQHIPTVQQTFPQAHIMRLFESVSD